MVWQIVNKVDTEKAKKIPLFARSPFIEMEGLFPEDADSSLLKKSTSKEGFSMDWRIKSVQSACNIPSPRVIKTHLPLEFLPPKLLDTCKVIFVGRNPKDACVSFYHHQAMKPEYHMKENFCDFATLYLKGAVEYGNYWTMLKVNLQTFGYSHYLVVALLSF